ncbi:MAG: O-antigen ligase family protein [Leptospiraceae bacterium]|nr:O-antigen ligase family protein [Leptospiraceae bacterium]
MDKIVLLPMIITSYLISKKELIIVFTYFFIPVLIFFPTYYDTKIVQGIPEFNFYTATLFPIIIVLLVNMKDYKFNFRFMDFLVLLLVFFIFFSQWYNSDYKIAQKLLFNELMAKFFGYFAIRVFFIKEDSRYTILKVILICAAIEGFWNTIEFRLWYNVFDDSIRRIWPFRVPWDLPMMRGGFKRAFGSFGHPIIAGYFFAMVFPLSIYFHFNPKLGKSNKTLIIAFLTIMGCISSVSRAPIAGLVLCAVFLWYGWSNKKILVITIISIVLIIGGIIYLPKIIAYVSVDRLSAETEDQRNAAYRKELLDNYLDIVDQKPLMGWGRFTVPWLDDQISIDNEYLFLALTHGKIAVFLYLFTVLFVLIRLGIFVFKKDVPEDTKRISWAFINALFSALFIQTTVWNGFQIVPILFMYLGMGENLMMIHEEKLDESNEEKFFKKEEVNYENNLPRTI